MLRCKSRTRAAVPQDRLPVQLELVADHQQDDEQRVLEVHERLQLEEGAEERALARVVPRDGERAPPKVAPHVLRRPPEQQLQHDLDDGDHHVPRVDRRVGAAALVKPHGELERVEPLPPEAARAAVADEDRDERVHVHRREREVDHQAHHEQQAALLHRVRREEEQEERPAEEGARPPADGATRAWARACGRARAGGGGRRRRTRRTAAGRSTC